MKCFITSGPGDRLHRKWLFCMAPADDVFGGVKFCVCMYVFQRVSCVESEIELCQFLSIFLLTFTYPKSSK